MQSSTKAVPGKGIVIASIIVAILFALIILYAGYVINTLPSSYFTNLTKAYSSFSAINLTGTSLKGFLSNVLYGYGIVFLILGLLGIPFVYMPLSHNLPEKASGPALAIGIIEIIVGLITIMFIIPGILMIVAWYQIRKFNREMALQSAIHQ
ncbi:hypothetical protein [Caldisphaera sp.]|uniref:hypothetical protein n=1 Tax=Caldisphaera sp. TaxID=2060322 RepID=UPI003D097D24